MVQNAIWLEPKTRKARNRLNEITDAMGRTPPTEPPQWELVGKQSRVGFSADSGPWLLVQPIAGPHVAAKFQRWVHASRDHDFAVHEC